MANAKMTEIERNGSAYIGQHFMGFVGDTVELGKGVHWINLDAPNNYTFVFSISVGDDNVTVSDVSISQQNCKPQLKAVWAGPKVAASKKGAVTVTLPTPQFGPPTGKLWCAGPIIVPCEKRKIALDIRTTPHGAEIWIDGNKQSSRTSQVVETELEVCDSKVDILLRLPGMANCNKKVLLPGTSTARVTCAFVGIAAK